ncbi:MAG: glycosyltransferase family 2 protein [Proteobacteria bacterium]|nr:glycosyltransferase family 2 protein [Pseudomonadota bacterium]
MTAAIAETDVELSVVVPVFQEETAIPLFLDRIIPILEIAAPNYEILFCLDPGTDGTLEVLNAYAEENSRIRVLVFSRRFGQPSATIAGIDHCSGSACVVIDVDLQDPPELIQLMMEKWREGYHVVYAQRRTRKGETIPKRVISYLGYQLINKISDVPIPVNTGDFRLLDRRVIEELKGLQEHHGFLRGLVAFVGYKQTSIQYDRDEREAGDSKYSQVTGSMRIGMNGIVAFSTKPLTMATIMGFVFSGFSFLIMFWYLIQKLFIYPALPPGLPTTVMMITFFGGIQLICLGIIGEYIGRIYEEVRRRPKYIVETEINPPEHSASKGQSSLND